MANLYSSIPTGWRRLIILGYIGFLIWMYNDGDFTMSKPIDNVISFGLANLYYWGGLFILLWIIWGFRK